MFSGLKLANTGAMTLTQFKSRAALFRNTFSSLTNFSSLPLPNRKVVAPFPRRKKRNIRGTLLVIATLLLIMAITAGMVFAFSPLRNQQGNNGATTTGQGTNSGISKTVVPQQQAAPSAVATHPTAKKPVGITIPAQPTQPPAHPRATPLPKNHAPSPTTPPIPQATTLSVAPVSLNATNCTPGSGNYTCFVALSLGAGAGNSQNWYTYSIGVGASFSPSSGTITPEQTIHIKIIVFNTCTKSGTFVFVGTKTNVTVAWNC
jgi:hypothetical protein